MVTAGVSRRIGRLAIAAIMTVSALSSAFAEHTGMTGVHEFRSMVAPDCWFSAHEGTQSPADAMQAFANELGLTGQQQQDLQILTADYGERLRDLAKLMSESGKTLMLTEPGDPDYWPLAQDVSATAASSAAETVILISEMREKINLVLTAGQRAELKRRIEERKALCQHRDETEEPTG